MTKVTFILFVGLVDLETGFLRAQCLIHLGIITHLLHWKWILNIVRRTFTRPPGQVRVNSVLNSLLFVTVTLIIFSGTMISKVVLNTFGLSGSHDMIWRLPHSTATSAALVLVGLHVALHWKWIVSTVRRYVWQPVFSRRPRLEPQPALKGEQGGAR